jgi:hypothetical protein
MWQFDFWSFMIGLVMTSVVSGMMSWVCKKNSHEPGWPEDSVIGKNATFYISTTKETHGLNVLKKMVKNAGCELKLEDE